MNDKELAKILEEWFEGKSFKGGNFLYRNPVAKVIQANMQKHKRWKNLNRGKDIGK